MKRANMEANEGKYNDLLNKQILKVSWLLHQSLLRVMLMYFLGKQNVAGSNPARDKNPLWDILCETAKSNMWSYLLW